MKYSEAHQIEYSECDENQHLKLTAMVDLLMQVSEHQLDQGGAGTQDLLRRGLGWVVTQYHFEIKRLPHPLEKVILMTEASGYNRFFEYRDFAIRDGKGQEIVTVSSQWVLFDLRQRKLVPTDLQLMKNFQVPLLKKMPRFPRLRPQEQYEQKRQYRVRYDDLDTNHHLTNSHYFNWFIDMVSRDFLRHYLVKSIDIKFNQEVGYGQEPFSLITLTRQKGGYVSYHALQDQAGQIKTVCQVEWRHL